MTPHPVKCIIEMGGEHAIWEEVHAYGLVSDDSDEEDYEEELDEVSVIVPPEGEMAAHVVCGRRAFAVEYQLPDMAAEALKVIEDGKFDSFVSLKFKSIKEMKPKYDLGVMAGSDVVVGNPKDRETWKIARFGTEKPDGIMLEHYLARSIDSVRVLFSDGKEKKLKIRAFNDTKADLEASLRDCLMEAGRRNGKKRPGRTRKPGHGKGVHKKGNRT